MATEPEKKLEQLRHRELRHLPELQAPSFLLQRVRATLEARAKLPWYQRPWFTWPVSLRLASATLMLALVSGLTLAIHGVSLSATALTQSLAQSPTVSTIMAVTNAVGNALMLAARTVNPLYLASAGALVALMYLTCIALGTACYRIAWNNR